MAIALCTYALLLKAWPSDTLQGAFGNFLLASSVYFIAWKVTTDGIHEVSLMANAVGHELEIFRLWSEAMFRDAGLAGNDLAKNMADKLGSALRSMPIVKVF